MSILTSVKKSHFPYTLDINDINNDLEFSKEKGIGAETIAKQG